MSKGKNIQNINKFLKFLKSLNENIIFTYPNADAGFNDYIKIIRFYLSNKINCNIVKNLGIKHYYTLLKASDLLIGNSSSGIIESASFNLPTINLGNRQKNRFTNQNVIHLKFYELKKYNIYKSKIMLKKKVKINNIYFKKNTSKMCVHLIKNFITKKIHIN
jgi:UDP-N-acetylglucosamine 2-epimerase